MPTSDHPYTNALIHESSPYLLQHAHNPVNWYPWGDEALEKAKKENKLLLVSIGYAACHWCHVMEHESFEDTTVAKLMNENFVCIKVDREERPDIDDVYMSACQLISQRGCGWPLNSFAMPDGRPVWAGTYFPKDQWINVLQQITKTHQDDPKRLEETATKIKEGIATIDNTHLIDVSDKKIDLDLIHMIGVDFIGNMDMQLGGRRGAPKFPMPNSIEYLLKYGSYQKDDRALKAATVTLDQMAKGGIFDQIGGGFSRYSTDAEWLVPHFEKMLYDNGQLLSLYANGYKLTKNPLYKSTIEKTVEFLQRELMDANGMFYSSLDADSEKEEGKFYIWTKHEVDSIIGDQKKSDLFCKYYDITDSGNWEHKNILRQVNGVDFFKKSNIAESEGKEIIKQCSTLLMAARSKRIRPATDDKILTSWNGLAVKGLIDAYTAIGETQYYALATKNMNFILNHQLQKDGRLYRNFKNGKSTINGFLDDYATVIEALITLYQSDFDTKWLHQADILCDYVIQHFDDENHAMFYYTSDIDPPLVSRKKEIADNVISSSNSIMARNLLKLGELLSKEAYTSRGNSMGHRMIDQIHQSKQPGFYANWCSHYLDMANPPFEVAVLGDQAVEKNLELQKYYLPNALFLGGKTEGDLELLKDKLREGETMIYVCQNKVCKLPVTDIEKAIQQMR